ncbi:hypothetical protein GPM19_04755 [Halomonas sp. ZH2S]|uniref:Uncharacterized protein n=1 Tax=Vreelandella zhuhanensis TaxID=2684210 RepID=A0A7X3KPI4_9GAMM|nr:hypothetical protein [Halomonas zhuhanensis]MWJ27524.1 hypothetical protein [Halomonas zhuhanensis]
MFDIDFIKSEKLPPLSWCMIFEKNGKAVLHHGKFVEIFGNGFFEGGWDGDVSDMGFDKSHFFLGSGGKFLDDGVLISTPGHALERIYSSRLEGKLYFSNSFPFILACSRQIICNDYYGYESDFASILNGVNGYVKEVPTKEGKVGIHYLKNIKIDRELNVVEKERPKPPAFSNFEHYNKSLSLYLEKFKSNITSSQRENKFDFCSTISNGYDAAACSAKAAEVGCEILCSFNSPEKYREDDGREISKALNFGQVEYRDANEYLNRDDLIEAEFLSSGELGTGIVFSAFEDLWAGKAVFMGERGDKLWDKNWNDVNDEMRVADEVFAGTSMIENRLRVGYILIPLPLFGALSWPSISRISNSEELRPFSVGGNYDRPIPRRILEEKGVSRHLFGMKKNGAGFNYRYDSVRRLKKRMSSASVKSFNDFILEYGKGDLNLNKIYIYILFFWSNKYLYANKMFEVLKFPKVFPSSKPTLIGNPGTPNDLMRWGVYETTQKYLLALEG